MQIAHVSDLHFGNHNQALQANLIDCLKAIQPNLVIASGDLVDSPVSSYFEEARNYLLELATTCKASANNAPRLIVIPGNHDYKFHGIADASFLARLNPFAQKTNGATDRSEYAKWFQQMPRQHYFQEDNVWIYGFDSAHDGLVSAGKIAEKELVDFHKTYAELERTHKDTFPKAFKIAVVHHHPLPVNWDTDLKQFLLLMENSGTFLAAVLNRKMDLVLHGHEHLQGRSRLRSSLGGRANIGELVVVSLGATLRKVSNPNRNWFNIISLASSGEATVTSYPSNEANFLTDEKDLDGPYEITPLQIVRQRLFEDWKKRDGFVYKEITSITRLELDGDAERHVECIDLETLAENSLRRTKHDLELPKTTGQIFGQKASSLHGGNLAGVYLRENPQGALSIDFGNTTLQVGEKVSYRYSWRALNAFAMDERQYDLKYADGTHLEFTHLRVMEPIETLRIVVKFPESFCPGSTPQPRVSKPAPNSPSHEWQREAAVELELRRTDAVRYIESLRTAVLVVTRPKAGYYYGVQWQVPSPSPTVHDDAFRPIVNSVREILVRASAKITAPPPWLNLLEAIGQIARDELLNGTSDELEVSLMAFDADRRLMVTVCGALLPASPQEPSQWMDYAGITFPFGAGLGGRAFKSNEFRLYVKGDDRPGTPSYYQKLPGRREHVFLLSIPLRSPGDENLVFATLNLGSYQPDCALRNLAAFSGTQTAAEMNDKLIDFQTTIERVLVSEIPKLAEKAPL